MQKWTDLLKLAFFTLMLYIWTADWIIFPGEKQGEQKKDFVLREYDELIDAKFPNVPWIDFIQAIVKKLLGKWIDWIVSQLNKNGDMKKLQAEVLGFFSQVPGTNG